MRYAVTVLFLLLQQVLFSQYYETGQDPASLKWVQIKTDRYRIIYPEQYGQSGIEFARSLDEAASGLEHLFPETRSKIPVIIHNYTTRSNGYVAWAPSRMEIYPTPEQNTIPLDPLKQLATHELTHVLQMESLNRGFSKGISYLLGEQVYGVVAFLLPLWYLEGDAVFAETILSGSGRGRSPSFQKELKAITVEQGRMYKYDKIVNGSFRDYVPNHYQTGYQIVTWTRNKYGERVWNKMLNYTARMPFTVNPVNISLKGATGLRKKDLAREVFDSLKTIWAADVTESGAVAYESINPGKRGNYINYYSPVVAGRDSIIAVKTSLSRSPEFVLVNRSEGSEKILHAPGQIYPYQISCGGNRLVWVETRSDPRWENREYSVIRLMDLKNCKIRSLSARSRYLSASVSPDGKVIAAVENSIDNKNMLVFVDVNSGEVLRTVPSPGNIYLQRPQWAEGSSKLTFISLSENGEGIVSFDTGSGSWENLIAPANNDLQASFLRNDSLFYVSSLSGTENIYLLTPDSTLKYITNSRFGATDPCLTGNSILFSDYTSLGNNICFTDIRSASAVSPADEGASSYLINRFGSKDESISKGGNRLYTPLPYRKWNHLFRFHSWMPFYADIEEIRSDPASVRPGVTLMTQNNLSTLISSVGYEYSEDKRHLFHTRITWKGWYPVLESRFDYGYSPRVSKSGEDVSSPSVIDPGISFTNSVYFPLSFSSGRFYQYLRPSLTSEYVRDYVYLKEAGTYDHGQMLLSGRIYFSNYHRYAFRDIYPRWAQTFDLNYTFAPFDRDIYGTSLSVSSAFYFPGIFPGNGIKISLEREKQVPQEFLLGSRISFPRGYENILSSNLWFISGDYVMPIAYPDFHIASLLYIKRLRTALFYDFARGKGNTYYEQTPHGFSAVEYHDYTEDFSSAGLELMADLNLFRIPYLISAGVQSSWIRGSSTPAFRFLLNIDLFGMVIGRKRM